MMDEAQIYDPRRAGLVERYHAQIHTSHQSVAEHTWQVMRILTTIWPQVPSHIMLYVIYHDVAEGVTGDTPYPVKLEDLRIKRLLDQAEERAYEVMKRVWHTPKLPNLIPEEKKIVKACELIEMLEWALYEINLGNRYAEIVVNRIEERLPEIYLIPHWGEKFMAYVNQRSIYEHRYQQHAK